jgi:DNA mismatch repair protein MutL
VTPPAVSADHPPTDAPLSDPLIDESLTIEPLGQIGDSYIVASCGDDMLVIDQHAAHERLMYTLVQRRFSEQAHAQQPLLVPLSFDLPASSTSHLEEMREVFGQIGIDLEPFGGQTVLIRSLPTDFEGLDIAAVVVDVAADLEAEKAPPSAEQVRDRVLTRMACHAAVKANRRLSVDEMRALIRDIIRARLPHTCPHGRPTMALLTLEQLDKQFKRK